VATANIIPANLFISGYNLIFAPLIIFTAKIPFLFHVQIQDPEHNCSIVKERIIQNYSSLKNISEAIKIADRVYLYDNSTENAAPRLILRTADGKIVKRYSNDLAEWVGAVIP
jgi:hypothetical protein